MFLVGVFGIVILASKGAAIGLIRSAFYSNAHNYTITVMPLFMLMGQFIFHAGVSSKLYKTCHTWLGALPGGLAVSTIAACGVFAAICGASSATCATFGTVSLPEMTKKYNYDPGYACGAIVAGGTLGILIPPSTAFIWYGILTGQSISKLFAAGFGVGVLLMLCYMITAVILAKRHPEWAPTVKDTPSLNEKLRSLVGSLPVLVIFLVVIGGIFLGVFTPNEGGAIGAFCGFLCLVFSGNLTLKTLMKCLRSTVESVGMLILILTCSSIFGSFLAMTRIPTTLANFVQVQNVSPYMLLILIIAVYLVLGMVMDALAMVLLTIPIFYPMAVIAGFNPIWYGVITVICMEMGQITPPVGMNLFIIRGMAPEIPMSNIITRSLPYVGAIFVTILILVIFPGIATYLPSVLYNNVR
jgi:tripartite ATP-independent transporter DctM subunit